MIFISDKLFNKKESQFGLFPLRDESVYHCVKLRQNLGVFGGELYFQLVYLELLVLRSAVPLNALR